MVTRDGSTGRDIRSPGVEDFGILKRGSTQCTPHNRNAHNGNKFREYLPTRVVGTSLLQTFEKPTKMSGWYVTMLHDEETQDTDPTYFEIWGTSSDFNVTGGCAEGGAVGGTYNGDTIEWCGVVWDKVGVPAVRYDRLSFQMEPAKWLRFTHLHNKELSMSRDVSRRFELSPPFLFYLFYNTLAMGIQGVLSFFVLVVAMRGGVIMRWRFNIHVLLGLTVGSPAVLSALAALTVLFQGESERQHLAWEAIARIVRPAIVFYACAYQGPWFVYLLGLSSVVDIAVTVMVNLVLFGEPFRNVSLTGFVWLFLCVYVGMFRVRDLSRSRNLFKADQERYDKLWTQLTQDEDSRMGIDHLKKVVLMIGLDETNYCRQHNRVRADRLPKAQREKYEKASTEESIRVRTCPLFYEMGHILVPSRPNASSLVSSFDQLYAQAGVANLQLLKRLRVWAEMTNGMFPVSQGNTVVFARWNDIKDDLHLSQQVRWTLIKRHGRVFEKLLRSYGNERARLLDISRNLIVFETMTDLTNCLGIIVTDENIRVERLKN
eukprot:CAMPEP_0173381676 /NCGR_PEP_ID=MMETSP1356-20130122/4074_1 /TAXON_ID=77927 ORGANISM="Hemiselmis virescens, Strain PCC157" /NCGR_SAMPLE_ID=MMETSP1356 /ASSEMBLY_ACC=CAM_ASM_000847 /LENGTH=544 /DNA_ID=CAMNT_0014335603 /DNA_START=233 /DNA_END=1864 /DNA_ORIENTATION=-